MLKPALHKPLAESEKTLQGGTDVSQLLGSMPLRWDVSALQTPRQVTRGCHRAAALHFRHKPYACTRS